MRLVPYVTGLALAGTLLAACGSDSGGPGPAAQTIDKATGNNGDSQTGPVGQVLPNPLRVQVLQGNAPVQGLTVTWSTGGPGAGMNPPQSQTDPNGIAASSWTLTRTAGPATAQAAVSGVSGSPVTFTATAIPGPAATFEKAGGDQQTVPANQQAGDPLTVNARDQFNNGVGGLTVTWSVTSGDATVNPTSGSTSNAGGASTILTAGSTQGPVVITATPGGGLPEVTFDATVGPPGPAPVTITASGTTFSPATTTVPAGTTINFVWGIGAHNVVSDGPSMFANSGAIVSGPNTHSVTLSAPGTYNYHCANHGAPGTGMNGTITVQ